MKINKPPNRHSPFKSIQRQPEKFRMREIQKPKNYFSQTKNDDEPKAKTDKITWGQNSITPKTNLDSNSKDSKDEKSETNQKQFDPHSVKSKWDLMQDTQNDNTKKWGNYKNSSNSINQNNNSNTSENNPDDNSNPKKDSWGAQKSKKTYSYMHKNDDLNSFSIENLILPYDIEIPENIKPLINLCDFLDTQNLSEDDLPKVKELMAIHKEKANDDGIFVMKYIIFMGSIRFSKWDLLIKIFKYFIELYNYTPPIQCLIDQFTPTFDFIYELIYEEILPESYEYAIENHLKERRKMYFPNKSKSARGLKKCEKSLIEFIRKDDIKNIHLFGSFYSFDFERTFPPSSYQVFFSETYKDNIEMSLLDIAAYYGSYKCFEFFFLNHSGPTNSTFKYALAGGHQKIIDIVMKASQKKNSQIAISSILFCKLLTAYHRTYMIKDYYKEMNAFHEFTIHDPISNFNPRCLLWFIQNKFKISAIYKKTISVLAMQGAYELVPTLLSRFDITEYDKKFIIPDVAQSNSISTLKFFLQSNPFYSENEHSYQILYYPIMNKNFPLFNYMLDHLKIDFKINLGKFDSNLPNIPILHYAASFDYDGAFIKVFLDRKFDVNLIDIYHDTALIYAIRAENKKAIELLIENGADLNRVCKDHKMALDYALQSNNQHIIAYFLSHGAAICQLNFLNICIDNNIQLLDYLYNQIDENLKQKMLSNKTDYLLSCCIEESVKDFTLDFLIDKMGFDVNFIDEKGNTPLSYAIIKNNVRIFDYLMVRGANPLYIKKSTGENLLFCLNSIQGEATTLAKKLIELGVDPLHKNKSGYTVILDRLITAKNAGGYLTYILNQIHQPIDFHEVEKYIQNNYLKDKVIQHNQLFEKKEDSQSNDQKKEENIFPTKNSNKYYNAYLQNVNSKQNKKQNTASNKNEPIRFGIATNSSSSIKKTFESNFFTNEKESNYFSMNTKNKVENSEQLDKLAKIIVKESSPPQNEEQERKDKNEEDKKSDEFSSEEEYSDESRFLL